MLSRNADPMSEITELIRRANDGEPQAREQLLAALYRDLRRLADSRLARSGRVTLLDTSSLVHDAHLKLLDAKELQPADRGRFLANASKAMRSLVVDEVRKRRCAKRGGTAEHVELTPHWRTPSRRGTRRSRASTKRWTSWPRSTCGWREWSRCVS